MKLHFSTISKYKGMFQKCYLEPAVNGACLFDQNDQFVGMIEDSGFYLDTNYDYADVIQAELEKRGIKVFDYETYQEIQLQQMIDANL